MLSIIICSKYASIDQSLAANIKDTVGVDYEIIFIDNSSGRHSIFEAYNQGVKRAKGEYLCFMHEDVIFHSKNWGVIVEDCLSKDATGALGVAGGCLVPPCCDWRFFSGGYVNLLQGTLTLEEEPNYYICYFPHKKKINASGKPLLQVAILDGVWMCFRKELFKKIRFDEDSFHSFHLYDSDISMQVNMLGKNLYVSTEILLEHKSEGAFSRDFEESMEVFNKKWAGSLPLVRGASVIETEVQKYSEEALRKFEMRLEYDLKVAEIRRFHSQKKSGIVSRSYTIEELMLIKQSVFRYVKSTIKNKRIPLSEVFRVVKKQLRNPLLDHKDKLFWKFIWYRLFGVAYLI